MIVLSLLHCPIVASPSLSEEVRWENAGFVNYEICSHFLIFHTEYNSYIYIDKRKIFSRWMYFVINKGHEMTVKATGCTLIFKSC